MVIMNMNGAVFQDGVYEYEWRRFQDGGYEYEWRSVQGWWI